MWGSLRHEVKGIVIGVITVGLLGRMDGVFMCSFYFCHYQYSSLSLLVSVACLFISCIQLPALLVK